MSKDHNQNINIVHVISSITDHGAQKNLKLFIKETLKKKLFKHIVISIKKPNSSSNIFKELEEMNIKIIEFNLLKIFLISTHYLKKIIRKNNYFWLDVPWYAFFYIFSKLILKKNNLIWTIRHSEPFHDGIKKLTKLMIKISYHHRYQDIT